MTRDGLVWIASYPKSGNTWARCLIASLAQGGAPLDFAALAEICPNIANRLWIEARIGLSTRDMSPDELIDARAEAHRLAARNKQGPRYGKTHDLYSARLLPPGATRAIVHIVRDPRDVAPSYAHHCGDTLDHTIELMALPGCVMSRTTRKWQAQADQILSTWSAHALSWLEQADAPALLMRYEDLRADTLGETARLARFLGLDADAAVVARAVAACDFATLKSMEEQSGFAEKPPGADRFFRQGQAGAWRGVLSGAQAARLAADHREVMTRLGYPV